jgi:hypothetical protein
MIRGNLDDHKNLRSYISETADSQDGYDKS